MKTHSKSTIEISESFQKALDYIQKGEEHLFITGKAGTGKSTLLNLYCSSSEEKIIVLAPTGVAALNVGGQTIHRFFGFKIDVTVESILKKKSPPSNAKLYKAIDTIIIDEVSMLRADLLDCIEIFLRKFGPIANRPFGGVRMVFIGDLYQLPPVVKNTEKTIFQMFYESPYFFNAHCMQNNNIKFVELKKVYRQKEVKFIELLNRIRTNSFQQEDLNLLNSRYFPNFNPNSSQHNYIYLTSTNKQADQINDKFLYQLKNKLYTSLAEISGDFGKEYIPNAIELKFKIGAQVMLLNNDSQNRWINGSIGIIKEIDYYSDNPDDSAILLELQDTNKKVWIGPHTWEVIQFKLDNNTISSEKVGTFRQYPFRLAWAITIHKSQGKTFNYVILDVGNGTFAPGQMYVGLSRCTFLGGLILKIRAQKRHIIVDQKVGKFLEQHYKE